MGLSVIMRDLGQIFAGNAQHVGQIVVAGGKHDLSRFIIVNAANPICGCDAKLAVFPSDRAHPFILVNVQAEMRGYVAVILQGFLPRGFLVCSIERNLADFQ